MDYTNKTLVHALIDKKELKTKRIIKAFFKIDRNDFVPREFAGDAYLDVPIPIGYEVTTSQPTTIAFMLEKLRPGRGDKILEIGTGSGYLTAILSKIVGEKGKIFSIEYIPEINRFAEENLKKYKLKNVELFVRDGKTGIPEKAPFDRIISSASAREIFQAWKDQLKVGGKIITAFDGELVLMGKISETDFKKEKFPHFLFVELK